MHDCMDGAVCVHDGADLGVPSRQWLDACSRCSNTPAALLPTCAAAVDAAGEPPTAVWKHPAFLVVHVLHNGKYTYVPWHVTTMHALAAAAYWPCDSINMACTCMTKLRALCQLWYPWSDRTTCVLCTRMCILHAANDHCRQSWAGGGPA